MMELIFSVISCVRDDQNQPYGSKYLLRRVPGHTNYSSSTPSEGTAGSMASEVSEQGFYLHNDCLYRWFTKLKTLQKQITHSPVGTPHLGCPILRSSCWESCFIPDAQRCWTIILEHLGILEFLMYSHLVNVVVVSGSSDEIH